MSVGEVEINRRIEAFMSMCRQKGMKVTHQRLEVFRELASSAQHPDAETVYRSVSRRIPTISRDTVYRTLSTLETAGLVQKVEPLVDRARYDANPKRHHHFVCKACGRISDFYSEALNVLPVPEAVQAMGVIDSAHVEVRGICCDCVNRRQDPAQPQSKT